MPLILIIKLRAVLSAFIMDSALPIISITIEPFFISDLSLTNVLVLHLLISNIILASSSPQTIVVLLALHMISARAKVSEETILLLVRSPFPTSSLRKLKRDSLTLRNASKSFILVL